MGEKVGREILNHIIIGVSNSSYYICVGIALTALLFYICGFKKAGKWIVISIAGYFTIQAIKAAII